MHFESEIAAYLGDESRGGREAQWAGPPAGQRGPEARAGLVAKGLAWLQKNQGVDSGARLCDLYLFIQRILCQIYIYKDTSPPFLFVYTSVNLINYYNNMTN